MTIGERIPGACGGSGRLAEADQAARTPPEAVIEHGPGHVQELRIERDYGLDAYLAILARERRLIARRVRKAQLPEAAFKRAAAEGRPTSVVTRAAVPVAGCRIRWRSRYRRRRILPERRKIGHAIVRLLDRVLRLGRLVSPNAMSAVLQLRAQRVVCLWGRPSMFLRRVLVRLGRRTKVFRQGSEGLVPGLRVPMSSATPFAERPAAVVASAGSEGQPNPRVVDLAFKLGCDGIFLDDGGSPVAGGADQPGLRWMPLPAEPPARTPPAAWPRISIVTVSFQQARFLEACLCSVLDQGYPNLEYIVIDGESTDGSREILERYRSRLSVLVIEKDAGQSDALNKGLSLATGDVMTWICSDDCLEPGALAAVAEAYTRSRADLIVGGCRLIDADGRTEGIHYSGFVTGETAPLSFGDLASFIAAWQRGLYFFQPEVFFSRDIWRRSGGLLQQHLHYAMDYDMFLRFALAGAQVHAVRSVLGCSRRHVEQKTRHELPMYLPTVERILRDVERHLLDVKRAACNLKGEA